VKELASSVLFYLGTVLCNDSKPIRQIQRPNFSQKINFKKLKKALL